MNCGETFSVCECRRGAGHEGNHQCLGPSELLSGGVCQGQWTPGGDIVAYPTGATNEAEALADALAIRQGTFSR